MIKTSIKKGIKSLLAIYDFCQFYIYDRKKMQHADILFVLPYFQTGGAERVHLNIVKSVQDKSLCILFTHNSATDNFKNDFLKYSKVIQINKILTKNNNFVNGLLKATICKTINRSKSIKSVFASNTNFFYEILPEIKKGVIKVDLIHAISNENDTIIEHYINSSDKINHRIVINKKAYNDVVFNYDIRNVNESYYGNISIVENAISIDESDAFNKRNNIKIGFVGRWSKEKRPEIFLKIAKELKREEPMISCVMAGIGMKSNVDKINEYGVSFLGEITNDNNLNDFYKSLTFVLITSYREGFPMVIVEAMAHGVIPISTNVGGIGEHLTNFENGILLENSENEDEIATRFVEVILQLVRNKKLTSDISLNSFNYARKHFNIDKFNKEYRTYLLEENES